MILVDDVIVDDCGFDVADSIAVVGATLHMPAFTKGHERLSPGEFLKRARKFANVRIHVERLRGGVCQRFTFYPQQVLSVRT